MTNKSKEFQFGFLDQFTKTKATLWNLRLVVVLKLLALLTLWSLNPVFAAEFEVGGDYSRSPEALVIKGRAIPVKFGAATIGFKTQLTSDSTIAIKLGKGFDPSVSRTFLDVDSNGPATCDMVAVDIEHLLTKIGPFDIKGGGAFKYQKVHAKLSGNKNGGPFTGTADIGARWLEAHVKASYSVSVNTNLYGQVGLQAWRYNFEAFGSMERVRVWTDSAEKGISPTVSVGVSRKIADTVLAAELSANQLRSDNRILVPALMIKASRAW